MTAPPVIERRFFAVFFVPRAVCAYKKKVAFFTIFLPKSAQKSPKTPQKRRGTKKSVPLRCAIFPPRPHLFPLARKREQTRTVRGDRATDRASRTREKPRGDPARAHDVENAAREEQEGTRRDARRRKPRAEQDKGRQQAGKILPSAHRARTGAIGRTLRHAETQAAEGTVRRRPAERVQPLVHGNAGRNEEKEQGNIRKKVAREQKNFVRNEHEPDDRRRRKRNGTQKTEPLRRTDGQRFIARRKALRAQLLALPRKVFRPLFPCRLARLFFRAPLLFAVHGRAQLSGNSAVDR